MDAAEALNVVRQRQAQNHGALEVHRHKARRQAGETQACAATGRDTQTKGEVIL